MTFFRAILISAFCALVSVPAFAGVGSVDSRENVNWADYPQIVHLKMHVITNGDVEYYSSCTGQYIAPNLILTASHCIKDDSGHIKQGDNFAINYKKEEFPITLLYSPKEYVYVTTTDDIRNGYDWAIFEVQDEKYFQADKYYNIQVLDSNNAVNVFNGGFGWVTKLTDADIEKLKEIYNQYYLEIKTTACNAQTNANMDGKLCKNTQTGNQVPLSLTYDPDEIQKRFESIEDNYKKYNGIGRSLSDDFDDHKLKVDSNCSVSKNDKNLLRGNCDSWGGNSGGAFISTQTGNLVGVLTDGETEVKTYDFSDDSHFAVGLAVQNFYNIFKELTKKNDDKAATETVSVSGSVVDSKTGQSIPGAILEMCRANGTKIEGKFCTADNDGKFACEFNDIPKGSKLQVRLALYKEQLLEPATDMAVKLVYVGDVADEETSIEEDKKRQTERLRVTTERDDISNRDFLYGIVQPVVEINRLQKLEEAYKKARENEKSLKNRMLGGLTMAATGIGGMQLAQGLAEQSADAAAERDMQAYLATFQCTAGGKTYSGGTSGIELAGANQLTGLYQQYVDLAADLKERKSALGMKAGIESEVILDKANTGLYDDVGKGIENGTYASLYRASKGNEKDSAKLSENKNTSATRVKGGAIAAGAGVVGGAVLGNIDFSSWGSGNASSAFSGLGSALGQAAGGLGGTLGQAAGALSGSGASGIDSSTINSVLQAVGK